MSLATTEYETLLQQINALTMDETNMIANMANISAVLFQGVHDLNWAGFYLYKDKQLVLGPFQGSPACIRIPLGKGVCGVAAQTQEVQLVDNVHEFAGHIACDQASNSEIVVPIVKNGVLIGVLDIDSPLIARFSAIDKDFFINVVNIFIDTLE